MKQVSLSQQYLEEVCNIQRQVFTKNVDAVQKTGGLIAESLANDGVLHVFGSGHSAMIALELVGRAGGLVPVNAIHDPTMGWAETLPGYGARLGEVYANSYGFGPGEVVIVVSNSGRNCAPLEVALAAQERGAMVVAVTSVTMSQESSSKHHSGKRLFEIADVVLDNCGAPGDAILEAPGGVGKTAPTSTFTGALLLELVLIETLESLHRRNVELPILRSQNLDGGAEYNAALWRRFQNRLRKPI